MPSCNGMDTSCAGCIGTMTRRASGQTSLRCLGTRTTEESTKKVLHMTVAVSHWCSLPHYGPANAQAVHGAPVELRGIDVCVGSCSQQVR